MPTPLQPVPATEPMPIWMAALVASEAGSGVRWQWFAGRAVYRNRSAHAQVIEPLGVRVDRGEALVVTWHPGDTQYTVQLYDRDALAA